jgi:hypothetical protein
LRNELSLGQFVNFFSVSSKEMAQTGPQAQQIPAGQPAVFTSAVAPPSYDSLPADQQKQQPPAAPQQQVPVQQLQQGVPFQAWPQGQVYQQPAPMMGGFPQQGPVQYIAVSETGHFELY